VALTGLLQSWASRGGILLFADTALLLAPARFFPRAPAVATVLVGALAADALRPGPYGLSATLLLPVLLLILPFQKSLRAWEEGFWIAGAVVVNVLLCCLSVVVWVARMRPEARTSPALEWVGPVFQPSLQCLVFSASASSLLLLLLGGWFSSLQTSLLLWAGNDVGEGWREGAG
jgi:hypothetical protein